MLIKERKNRNLKKKFVLLVSLLFLFLQSCSSVKVISDQLFDDISTYEYGQSRTKLTEFSLVVDSVSQSSENRIYAEENILEFLKSDATFASKQFACRELRIIGSEKSVSVLTDMMLNEKTLDIAKYALEDIPGESINEELTDMLPKTTKKVQLGIINTLAVRKSKYAVSSIAKFLDNQDKELANSAASALGKIGNFESLQYLDKYIDSSNDAFRIVVLDSYLSCVDELVAQGEIEKANTTYTKLYNQDVPFNIKQASLVGIINTSKNKSEEILNRINSVPAELKFIPISKIKELSNNIYSVKYAKLLSSLEPANQVQLLTVIDDSNDKNIKPFVLKTLNSKVAAVRIASIKALTNIGDDTDVITLAGIAANKTGEEGSYATSSLTLLRGDLINKTIVSNISSSDDNIRNELIKAVGNRNIKSAFDDIIEYAKSENKKTKTVSLKSLGEISNIANLPSLIDLLISQKENSGKIKIERTISSVLKNNPSQNGSTSIISALQTNIDEGTKLSLLRLLGFTIDNKALQILRHNVKSDNDQTIIAASTGLSNWHTPDVLNDLMNVMVSSKNEKVISTSLKGFTKFIGVDNKLTNVQKVELYKKSLLYSKSGNEKNIALDGIGHVDCLESLEVFKSYVNQPDVSETVNDGINRVSWHIFSTDPEKVNDIILDFMTQIKEDRFQRKSKQLLNAIKKHIAKKG